MARAVDAGADAHAALAAHAIDDRFPVRRRARRRDMTEPT
jgi:hypothetical protein